MYYFFVCKFVHLIDPFSKHGFDLYYQHLDQDTNQEVQSQNDKQKDGARKSFAAQVSFSESETCESESNNDGTRKSANVQVSFTESDNFDTESEKSLVQKTAILRVSITSDESETSPQVTRPET
jgi:hypothetical protein